MQRRSSRDLPKPPRPGPEANERRRRTATDWPGHSKSLWMVETICKLHLRYDHLLDGELSAGVSGADSWQPLSHHELPRRRRHGCGFPGRARRRAQSRLRSKLMHSELTRDRTFVKRFSARPVLRPGFIIRTPCASSPMERRTDTSTWRWSSFRARTYSIFSRASVASGSSTRPRS